MALAATVVALVIPASAFGASGQIKGTVQGGSVFPDAFRVTLFQAIPGASKPRALGSAMTRRGGKFLLPYRGAVPSGVRYMEAVRRGGGAEAGFPVSVSSLRLATALGDRGVPGRVTINERTTVAMAFAMAQFIEGDNVAGKNPGLRNAAAMTTDLVGCRNGGLSPILRKFPNGRSTSTWRTFDSLANLVGSCRRPNKRCARLLELAAPVKTPLIGPPEQP